MKSRRPSEDYAQLGMVFDLPAREPRFEDGSLDIAVELRAVLSRALKECPLSRHQVAARMGELTGADISKSMLDHWTAESHDGYRFPVEYLPAFEVATGSTLVTEFLGKRRGYQPLFGEDAIYAEIARLERMEDAARERRQLLRRQVQQTGARSSGGRR